MEKIILVRNFTFKNKFLGFFCNYKIIFVHITISKPSFQSRCTTFTEARGYHTMLICSTTILYVVFIQNSTHFSNEQTRIKNCLKASAFVVYEMVSHISFCPHAFKVYDGFLMKFCQ